MLYLMLGDLPAAEALYREVLAIDASHLGADFYLANLNLLAGRFAEAAAGYRRLLSAPEWFLKRIVDGVLRECPGARIRRPELSPAIGAVIMAAHADGCAATNA